MSLRAAMRSKSDSSNMSSSSTSETSESDFPVSMQLLQVRRSRQTSIGIPFIVLFFGTGLPRMEFLVGYFFELDHDACAMILCLILAGEEIDRFRDESSFENKMQSPRCMEVKAQYPIERVKPRADRFFPRPSVKAPRAAQETASIIQNCHHCFERTYIDTNGIISWNRIFIQYNVAFYSGKSASRREPMTPRNSQI